MNGASADPSPGSENTCSPSGRLTAGVPVNRYGGSFDDADRLAAFLRSCGFSVSAAAAKAELFARCAAALQTQDSTPPENGRAYFVPGRIEVLGKHTDYAGGSSLVAAAERGFCLIAVAARDPEVRVTDAIRGETIQFAMDSELAPPPGHWSNYPMTVARRLVRNFPGATRGAQIAFASDLPPAAGMSSSSALMVAIWFALADANDIWSHERYLPELNEPLNLAGYLATIENGQSYGPLAGDRGVGTFGGSEDHTAILCARPGFVSQYAYCPVQVPAPDAAAGRLDVRHRVLRRGRRENRLRVGEIQSRITAGGGGRRPVAPRNGRRRAASGSGGAEPGGRGRAAASDPGGREARRVSAA